MSELAETKSVKSLMYSKGIQNKLKEILGKNAGTFATSVVQLTSQSEQLALCEPKSVLGAAMTAATLNLPLNQSIGQAYVVPFNTKDANGNRVKKAQFILGYKGLKQLAIRSGQFLELECKKVYEGQKVEDDSFSGFHFEWGKKTSDKIVGYASYYKLINGFESTFFMSYDEMEQHGKKFSQTYKKGFGLWKDEFDKMGLKTVTKLHLNSGEAPLSIEMQTAIQRDQAVVSYNDENQTEDVDYEDATEKKPQRVEVDHERERIMSLINDANNPDDFEFIRGNVGGDYDKEIDERIKHLIISAKDQKSLDAAKLVAGESYLDLIKKKQKEFNK